MTSPRGQARKKGKKKSVLGSAIHSSRACVRAFAIVCLRVKKDPTRPFTLHEQNRPTCSRLYLGGGGGISTAWTGDWTVWTGLAIID